MMAKIKETLGVSLISQNHMLFGPLLVIFMLFGLTLRLVVIFGLFGPLLIFMLFGPFLVIFMLLLLVIFGFVGRWMAILRAANGDLHASRADGAASDPQGSSGSYGDLHALRAVMLLVTFELFGQLVLLVVATLGHVTALWP